MSDLYYVCCYCHVGDFMLTYRPMRPAVLLRSSEEKRRWQVCYNYLDKKPCPAITSDWSHFDFREVQCRKLYSRARRKIGGPFDNFMTCQQRVEMKLAAVRLSGVLVPLICLPDCPGECFQTPRCAPEDCCDSWILPSAVIRHTFHGGRGLADIGPA